MKSAWIFVKNLFSKLNKYWVATLIFLVITFCIGDSTFYRQYEYRKQIQELEAEITKYRKEEAENKKKLEALKSDNESLERFAREKYLMTKPGEELFLIK